MFCCDRKMYKYIFSCYICVIVCVLYVSGHFDLDEGTECYSESDKLNGTCVSVRHCLSALNEIKRKHYPQICSFKGLDPIVCCTDCDLVNDTSQFLIGDFGNYFKKTGSKSSDKCLEYLLMSDPYSLLEDGRYRHMSKDEDKKCYVYGDFGGEIEETVDQWVSPYTKRVKRAEPEKKNPHSYDPESGANLARFPHMALLGYGETVETAAWVCGGSVISHWFVITAGHCISTATSDPVKYIALGIQRRSELSEYQLYIVKRIIPHPQYKSPSKYHDIALLETTEWIKFGRFVSPICLHDGSLPRLKIEPNAAVSTGYGTTGPKMSVSDHLLYIVVTKFSNEECISAYPAYRHLLNGFDPETQLCYGDKVGVRNSCQGDSGGPLFETTSYFHEQRLIGVVSTGRQCGTVVGNPGIYTRVEHYLPWIESIVWPS